MTRSLKIHQPKPYERRRLQRLVEETTDPQIRRRAEAILFYADGLNAVEIAAILKAHPNTIYSDLHAFDQHGLNSLCPLARGGAPPRLTPEQREQIVAWAECEPVEFGLPYGRWSLAKFRDFLIRQKRLLKQISREHLRGLLKQAGIRFQRVRRKLMSRDPQRRAILARIRRVL
jgi:transposase